MSFFYVHPDEIDRTAEKLKAARDLIPQLQDRLDDLENRIQSSDCMSQDGDADGKGAQYCNTWNDEIGTLRDMCDGYDEALTTTADAYRQADEEIAAAFAEAQAAQMPTADGDVAV